MLGPGVLGMLLLVLWVYCVIDIISTDDVLVRNLPKLLWLVLVVFVPFVGSLAWLAVGRPLYAGVRPGGVAPRPVRPRVVGPEDDIGFIAASAPRPVDDEHLRRWEDDLARRERELRGDGEETQTD